MNDKVLHFVFGIAITAMMAPFGLFFGFAMAVLIGALKEWWDYKHGGTVEVWDFLATGGGGGTLILWWAACTILTKMIGV